MAPGVRVYTVKGQFDNSEILQRFIEIQSAKERAFEPIDLATNINPDALKSLLSDIQLFRTEAEKAAAIASKLSTPSPSIAQPLIGAQSVPQLPATEIDNTKLQREELVLAALRQQLEIDTQRNDISLSGAREQITLAARLAQVKVQGEIDAQRIAERSRAEELSKVGSSGANTGDIETRHIKEREVEQRKLQSLIDDANNKRLIAEQRIEQVSSRNILERIRGEQQVAVAVERVAQARLAEAQSAVRTASEDGRAAAEQKVITAIEQVNNAQRERAALQERVTTEEIAAETRIAEATTKAAQERIAAEKRVQSARQQATQQAPSSAGSSKPSLAGQVEGIANVLTGGLQAFATVQLVRQAANATAALDTLRTQAERSRVSLDILSGGASNAAARIEAIKLAGGGAITALDATQIAVQATALKLANTTDEFGKLTTAARAVALVSPVIKDIGSAISEISLAGANQSFRRLDQLGLSVDEVKAKISELQSADASLSDQQAFSAAVVDTLNAKYGALLQTTQAQASGQEQLNTAFSDFKTELANSAFIRGYDNALGELAQTLERIRALTSTDITFFGSLQGAKSELEKMTLGINEADSTWSKFKKAFAGDLEAPAVASPFKKDNLESAIQLFDQVKKLQDSGAASANQYSQRLQSIVATLRLNTDATKDYSAEITELSKQIDAASQLQTNSSQAGKAYAAAQNLLGESFINQSGEAQKLVTALSDIQAEFERTGDTEKYNRKLNETRLGFELLTRAAGEYNKSAESKKRDEVLGDAESGLVKSVEAEAAQLIASGENYDKVIKELQVKKALIKREIEKIPADVNPDNIPLIVARIKFEVDKTELDNLDTRSAQNIINDAIQQAQAETKAERAKQSDDRATGAKDRLKSRVEDTVLGLIKDGLDPTKAEEIIREYNDRISKEVNGLGDSLDTTAFNVKITDISNGVEDSLTKLSDSFNLSGINPQDAISTIVAALDDLDSAAGDGIPGFSTIKSDLSGLLADIMETGTVTKDQAQALSEYTALANAAGSETGFYAQAIQGLGFEFFNNDQQAGSLINRMVELDAAHKNGKISSGAYAGQLSALMKALYDVALQAGVSKDVLDGVFGSANAFIQSNTGSAEFQSGQKQGETFVTFESLIDEQSRREKERQAADRETTRLQNEAAKALKESANQTKSDIASVPGLTGVTEVTAEDMARAQAGLPVEKVDDFLRQLADLIENGVKRPGVSIERAVEALQNIGVSTEGMNNEAIFLTLKQAWADSSLFAGGKNTDLINQNALAKEFSQKQLARQGEQDVLNFAAQSLGVSIEELSSTLSGSTEKVKQPLDNLAASVENSTSRINNAAQVFLPLVANQATVKPPASTDFKLFLPFITSQSANAPSATAPLNASPTATSTVDLRTEPDQVDTFIKSLETALLATATIDLRTEPDQVATFLKSLESSLAVTAQVTLAQVDALPQPLPPASQVILGPQPADPTKPKEQSYLPDFNIGAVTDQLAGAVSSPEITALFSRAAESGAAAFVSGFTTYDFGGLLAIPIAAMEAAMLDGKTAERLDALGAAAAITLKGGFARQTAADDWMGDVVASIEARVTNNVLSTLAN